MAKDTKQGKRHRTTLSRRSFIGGSLAATLAAAVLPNSGGVVKQLRAREAKKNAPRWIGHF